MNESNGLSAGDILALTKQNGMDGMNGGYFWWVIIFFIIAGVFGGGNLFGRNNYGAENALLGSDEFIKRDIFNTNQNVSTTGAQTQQEILGTGCQTQRDVLESRYTTQLGLQQLQNSQQNCCLAS